MSVPAPLEIRLRTRSRLLEVRFDLFIFYYDRVSSLLFIVNVPATVMFAVLGI